MPYLVDVYADYGSFKYQPVPLCGPLHEVIYGSENPAKDGVFTVIPRGKVAAPSETGHSVVEKEVFESKFKAFTSGLFSLVDWSNVLVIGGAVVSSLLGSVEGFESSDVDIYIYGIAAEADFRDKVQEIIEAIVDASNDAPHVVVRTPFTVTIGFGGEVRPIQIITAPWKSVDHVLSTCDIEPTAVGYNGSTVLATPRARFSYNNRCIVANERSVSVRGRVHYPLRMAKYARRGFSVVDPDMHESTFRDNLPELNWVPRLAVAPSEINSRMIAPGDLTLNNKKIHPADIRMSYSGFCLVSRSNPRGTYFESKDLTLNRPPILNADPDAGFVQVKLEGSSMAIHCGRIAARRKLMSRKSFVIAHCLGLLLPRDLLLIVIAMDPTENGLYNPPDTFPHKSSYYNNNNYWKPATASSSMPFGVSIDQLVNWAKQKELQSRQRSLVNPYSRCPGKYEIIESDYIHLTSFEPLVDPFEGDVYRCDVPSSLPPSDGRRSTFAKTYSKLLSLDEKIENKYVPSIKAELAIKKLAVKETNERCKRALHSCCSDMRYAEEGTDFISSYFKHSKKSRESPRPRLWWKRVDPRKRPGRTANKARARDRSLKRIACSVFACD